MRNLSLFDVFVQVLVAIGVSYFKGETGPEILERIGFTVPLALICIGIWRTWRGA